jgi:eukaryotic-like serine/threonine-protein kinase
MADVTVPEQIGHYRIVRKIGEGGMGVVFAAHDPRLDRRVALKVIRDAPEDESARTRFWREARAAARVNHPKICQLYEIGEDRQTLFLAMELLEGESLADRIARGPLHLSDAVSIAIEILAALDALHSNQLVHRDLKPSNVFITSHGVKVLDFGLATVATSFTAEGCDDVTHQLTERNVIMGTPRYMAPEQLRGAQVDPRADLFAAGAILFEMLSGRPAFAGDTLVDVLHAVAFEETPQLDGDGAMATANAIVRRATAKMAADRYDSAASMAQAMANLRGLERQAHEAPVTVRQPMSWLIVLPFRVLRSDAEAEFLAFGLADAITSSFCGLQSVGLRSSAVAARYANEPLDLDKIASEAHVDLVLTGTFMRAGQQVRVNTQLVEAPAGTLLWSHTAQVTMGDVFQVHDHIVQRIVGSLALPLTARDRRLLRHDVPASTTAYELYVRASQISQPVGLSSVDQFKIARDLYRRCIEEDPRYAPAWARLARCYRIIGKAGEDLEGNLAHAESCLKRALDLNSDLPMAHNLYAQLETDLGRSKDALIRLTSRAMTSSSDPEVFAGLVLVCRYCGPECSILRSIRASGIPTGCSETTLEPWKTAPVFSSKLWCWPRWDANRTRSRSCASATRRAGQR